MLRSATTSFYEADGLGTVTSLSNTSGALAQTYTFDSFGKQAASSGSLTNPFQYTGREFDPETGLYYYRARYYDPTTGRFLSEDPVGFRGGMDFYSYVLNEPTQLTDPMGLSPQDVRRMREQCKKCTQHLTDAGERFNGSGRAAGWWNDFSSWFIWKREGCWTQALKVEPCLENPIPPYDDNWNFNVVPIEGGFHHVIQATDSDPNDPIVYCDPWRNISWTAPKKAGGATGKW
jgi:RHS repeat-associated protein